MSPWFDTTNKTTIFKSFIILKSIPVIQKQSFDNNIVDFKNIIKADPNYNRPARIDMILGIEVWAEIVNEEIIRSKNGLCAQNTSFGHAIFESLTRAARNQTKGSIIATAVIDEEDVNERLYRLLLRFWEIEETHEITASEDDKRAEEIFTLTTSRAASGRYIVQLPMLDGIELGESRSTALHRFYALERRLDRTPELRGQYNDFYERIHRARSHATGHKRRKGIGLLHPPSPSNLTISGSFRCKLCNIQRKIGQRHPVGRPKPPRGFECDNHVL